jgi:hypothetical protein
VVRPLVAGPRDQSERAASDAADSTKSPAVLGNIVLPDLMPSRSRTGFGIVTCPLRVTVTSLRPYNTGMLKSVALFV